ASADTDAQIHIGFETVAASAALAARKLEGKWSDHQDRPCGTFTVPAKREATGGHARRTIRRGMSADRRSSCSAATCSAAISSGASTVPKSWAGVPLSLMICQRTGFALARGLVGFLRKTLASPRLK